MLLHPASSQAGSLARRLAPLAYGLIALVALILLMTWITLQIQTTLAGFLNGESRWSKAQKQSVVDLLNYAATGDRRSYADFQRNFLVLDAMRSARDGALSGRATSTQIEAELQRAGTIPVAVRNVVLALRYFGRAPYIHHAVALWESTDAAVGGLREVATQLHRSYAASAPSALDVAAPRERINALNAFIQPRSNEFSTVLAHGSVVVERVLFVGVTVAALVAIALWLWMARRVLAGIRGSEERYRLLFDSAPDAIVMVDEATGCILDANLATGAWTGRAPQDLTGVAYASLFAPTTSPESATGGILRGPGNTSRVVETQTSVTRWGAQVVRQAMIRDISERIASEHDRRIAAEALASIAEGVIIADAERCVLTMNAAATRLTGFRAEELVGKRFDATRSLVDGGPLPAAVWDEVVATHHWAGEVQSMRTDGSTYAERLGINMVRDADHKALYYVAVFSDVSMANADRRRLERLAAHDALTGLCNRSEFQRHCDAAIKRIAPDRGAVAVLFVDLDAFKFVNDSYSHAVGDRLLKLVAKRIVAQMRDGDIAGRIGGDEFTVLLPGLAVREDAATPARRLLKVLAEPFHVDDYEIVLSASIGIACYPLDGMDAVTLIGNADAAMYAAKSEERNAWRFYAPTMQVDAGRRMVLATELRQALAEQEFRLVYQPSVELKTGRTVGVEALIRWRHPQRGEVLPGEFIPIAESIGLIHLIDMWVLDTACAQIHAWDALDMPPVRVAVNVSARWFGHPAFIDSVRQTLAKHGVGTARIVLEITEGAMLRLGEATQATMRALHALGIGVAIDDFGTGYASMAYLKLPAVSYLKIDGSFVSGLPASVDDAAIVSATLAMAGSLGLTTIAECIENEAQHEFLLRAGCTEGQGYLYSYPLPSSALEHMLRPQRHTKAAKLRLVPRRHG